MKKISKKRKAEIEYLIAWAENEIAEYKKFIKTLNETKTLKKKRYVK